MAYKIYGDGDIYKDGKPHAKIYSNGEIWKDNKPYAKIHPDGEIWKDGKKCGKIYGDGEVYIDDQPWGKIYTDQTYSTPKQEDVYTEYTRSNDNGDSSFGIPQIDFSDSSAIGGYVIAFIVIAVLILAAFYLPIAATGQALIMWKTFTIDTLSYGFMGIIAAALLVVGTIFGFMTQLKKFKGGIILGLIVNTIIVAVAVLGGQFLVWGPMAFNSLGSDTFSIFSAFALMAAIPTLICKALAVLSDKFNWGLTNETPKPVKQPVQKTVSQPKTTSTVNKTVTHPKTTTAQQTKNVSYGKENKIHTTADDVVKKINQIKNKTFETTRLGRYIIGTLVFLASISFLMNYSLIPTLFDLMEMSTALFLIFGAYIIGIMVKNLMDLDLIKGSILFAIISSILLMYVGNEMIGRAIVIYEMCFYEYGFMFGLAFIVSSIGLSYSSGFFKENKKVSKNNTKQTSTTTTTKTSRQTFCPYCGAKKIVPGSLKAGQPILCDGCKKSFKLVV